MIVQYFRWFDVAHSCYTFCMSDAKMCIRWQREKHSPFYARIFIYITFWPHPVVLAMYLYVYTFVMYKWNFVTCFLRIVLFMRPTADTCASFYRLAMWYVSVVHHVLNVESWHTISEWNKSNNKNRNVINGNFSIKAMACTELHKEGCEPNIVWNKIAWIVKCDQLW